LKLAHLPRRIEAFDCSNLFGTFAVGSMVVFSEGKPLKAHYRRFRIETVHGIDDVQMMREVIRRRYSGTLAMQLPRPDLILVDGGRGQLSAAVEELAALSLRIPALGLAKRFERIFLPDSEEPIVLLPTSPVLHLVQHVRDEAHRFAVGFHRRIRRGTVSASLLDAIPGVGPRRKMALLRHFGSLKALAQASAEEIARVGRLPHDLALRIQSGVRPQA
jgi:excinuclease ABC subunit C